MTITVFLLRILCIAIIALVAGVVALVAEAFLGVRISAEGTGHAIWVYRLVLMLIGAATWKLMDRAEDLLASFNE